MNIPITNYPKPKVQPITIKVEPKMQAPKLPKGPGRKRDYRNVKFY